MRLISLDMSKIDQIENPAIASGNCIVLAACANAMLILLWLIGPSPSIAAEVSTPPSPTYLGEIRRDESGRLIAVPPTLTQGPIGSAQAPVSEVNDPLPGSAGKSTVGREARQLGAASATLASQPLPASGPRLIRVGPQQQLTRISDAARQARNGDTVEIEAGDYVGDVAVWTQDNLTIRGVSGRPRLIAGGTSAEGKAIWVIRGGKVAIDNIEFTGARVKDKNGAGIRFEKGVLFIKNCRFVNNENGILTGSGDLELSIESSEFGHNGAGDGKSHNIYVGSIRKLLVTASYFHHANIGHLIKSRAAEHHILYNRLTDEIGGRASYELEFPNGGLAVVIGNILHQSSQTDNSTMMSFGAEGYKWPRNELHLINNTFADDYVNRGTFLRVAPGAGYVRAGNNLLLGRGTLDVNEEPSIKTKAKHDLLNFARRVLDVPPRPDPSPINGEFINNPSVDFDAFAQATRHDYRVTRKAAQTLRYVPLGQNGKDNLSPDHEYVHPLQVRQIAPPLFLPGAIQTVAD